LPVIESIEDVATVLSLEFAAFVNLPCSSNDVGGVVEEIVAGLDRRTAGFRSRLREELRNKQQQSSCSIDGNSETTASCEFETWRNSAASGKVRWRDRIPLPPPILS